MYDLPVGLCSTIAAPIFREEVGAKDIMSSCRVAPYIALAFARWERLVSGWNSDLVRQTGTGLVVRICRLGKEVQVGDEGDEMR
jgi:hypothetical protein